MGPLPNPAPLDPALVFPSATHVQPTPALAMGMIPAFPGQSNFLAGSSATCLLAPARALLPAVWSACNADDGELLPHARHVTTWLFAAYAPAILS